MLDIHMINRQATAMTTKLHHWMRGQNQPVRDQWLADLCGCDRSMITKIRLGTATPSLSLALRISRRTGIDVRHLMPPMTRPREAAE